MNTRFFKLFVIALVISLASCKRETKHTFTDYLYADKPESITCENFDTKLLKEALYSFEDDIANHYDAQTKNLSRSYNRFINEALSNRLKYEDVISAHTVNVFEAMKNNTSLWNQGNAKSNLSYNSEILKCIVNNIKNNRLKSTFNALLTTNSMSPALTGDAVRGNVGNLLNDKYLATYVALDLYYAKLFDVDFTTINFEEPQTNVDFNQKPPKEPEVDPHAGHNHD